MTTQTALPTRELMRNEMRSLLGLTTQPNLDQPLSGLGLTSLLAVTLQYRLQAIHGIALSLEDLMGPRSINELLASQGDLT